MSHVIRLSDKVYKRLESFAVGFDTPSALIERLLDEIEGINNEAPKSTSKKLELTFNPTNENEFKRLLLIKKRANVKLHRTDGSTENRVWRAERISKTSNIRGNIWSSILRGWKKKGIVKAEFIVQNEST